MVEKITCHTNEDFELKNTGNWFIDLFMGKQVY